MRFRGIIAYMVKSKRLLYYTICNSAFAGVKGISQKEAYNYLEEFKGIDFLEECYDAEHLLSIEDAVDDLTSVCKNNGGIIE